MTQVSHYLVDCWSIDGVTELAEGGASCLARLGHHSARAAKAVALERACAVVGRTQKLSLQRIAAHLHR